MTGGPLRGRPRLRPKGFDEVPELSKDEIERRLSGAAADPEPDPALDEGIIPADPAYIPADPAYLPPDAAFIPADEPDSLPADLPPVTPADPPGPPTTVVRSSGVRAPVNPRVILWRDAATILVGIVLLVLAGGAFLPGNTGGPADTALPSQVNVGPSRPGITLAPGATFGPIIDPSLGIDATPTPIPVITLGPSPSPSPKVTPKPTPKPTLKTSPKPPTAPPSTAPPTEPPPTEPPPTLPPPPTDPPPTESGPVTSAAPAS